MLKSSSPWATIGLIAAALAYSPLGLAQDGPGNQESGEASPGSENAANGAQGNPGPDGSADAEMHFGQTAQLTPEEQRSQAASYMQKMQAIHQAVKKLADAARAQRDLIKLNCVNDKLLQVRGNLNVADQTSTALQTAIATSDEGGRHHEFSKLTIIFQKVTVLGQEANACVGEEVAYVGQTRVTLEIDPNVAAAPDPSEEGPPLTPPGRPPLVSPFL